MPVEELGAVEQGPGGIDHGLALLYVAGLGIRGDGGPFGLRRVTRQDEQVEPVDDLARSGFGLDQILELPALFELALNMSGIEQMQALRGGRTVVALGFEAGVARRAAKPTRGTGW